MGQISGGRMRRARCPSCGATILFRRDRNRVGTCPRCGESLIQTSWLSRRLEILDDELEGDAFDESDDWARRVLDEIR